MWLIGWRIGRIIMVAGASALFVGAFGSWRPLPSPLGPVVLRYGATAASLGILFGAIIWTRRQRAQARKPT